MRPKVAIDLNWNSSLEDSEVQERSADVGQQRNRLFMRSPESNIKKQFRKKYNLLITRKQGRRSAERSEIVNDMLTNARLIHVGNVKEEKGEDQFYLVILKSVNRCTKETLVSRLSNVLRPLPFIPICWSISMDVISFYVEGTEVANKLKNFNKEIMSDSFVIVNVLPESPIVNIEKINEPLHRVLQPRYCDRRKSLDLSHFYADPNFEDIFCPLYLNEVLLQVVKVITQVIPDLDELNLNKNRLTTFSKLFAMCFPNLKVLHLRNNKIDKVRSLRHLEKLPITELVLDGNPFCQTLTPSNRLVLQYNFKLFCPQIKRIKVNDGILYINSSVKAKVDELCEQIPTVLNVSNEEESMAIEYPEEQQTQTSQELVCSYGYKPKVSGVCKNLRNMFSFCSKENDE